MNSTLRKMLTVTKDMADANNFCSFLCSLFAILCMGASIGMALSSFIDREIELDHRKMKIESKIDREKRSAE